LQIQLEASGMYQNGTENAQKSPKMTEDSAPMAVRGGSLGTPSLVRYDAFEMTSRTDARQEGETVTHRHEHSVTASRGPSTAFDEASVTGSPLK